jgi:hypothetical protein
MRMSKAEAEEEWTQLEMSTIEFDRPMRDGLFTLSNLRNPRE